MNNLKRSISIILAITLIVSCFTVSLIFPAYATVDEGLEIFNSYVSELGNDFTKNGLLTRLKALDENAVINEYFVKHSVDGIAIKGTYASGMTNYDGEMIIPGNDGYVAINATVNGQTFSSVACIPHVEEEYVGEVAYYTSGSGCSKGFKVTNGVVTDYTGNATILIFANEKVSINMSNATCKDKIQAIYFRNGYNNNKPLQIATRSFSGWSKLKAVMFQTQGVYVCGTFGEYAFAQNPSLKYVRLMDSFRPDNGSGYGVINDYMFYDCPKLENCRGGYMRLAGAQYGYGAFLKTAIRDYYLSSSMQYKNGANQGNVFGSESVCGGEVNVLTFTQARNNISATHMATLAQAAADNYTGTLNADSVKSSLVSSYSEFGSATADWTKDFKINGDIITGVLTITKENISVDVEFYRNNNEAIKSLSVEGYPFDNAFSSDRKEYTITAADETLEFKVTYKLNFGAELVSLEGNTDLAYGEKGKIVLKVKDANKAEHTYIINIERKSIEDDSLNAAFPELNSYVAEVGNDFTKSGFLTRLKVIDPDAVINECFIKHAVDGMTVKGTNLTNWDGEMIIPGNDGYVAVIATVNGSVISGVARITHKEEIITDEVAYYSAADRGDFLLTDGVVTDYTGNASILIFANEEVEIDMSNATCKEKIKAIYFRSGYNSNKKFKIAAHSFENWSNLQAIMFQVKEIFVSGEIGEYAFANNPSLKYVRMMDSYKQNGGNGYGRFGDYAFYNCPKLENCRGGYLRLTPAQYGYGVFNKTGIRDYYLPQSIQYNNGASQGNVFGVDPSVDGTINILTFYEARNKISLTHSATLAQAALDGYKGADNMTEIKAAVDAAYSEFAVETFSGWTNELTVAGTKIFGTIAINKGEYSIPLKYYRNENQSLLNLSIKGYSLSHKFVPERTEYTIYVPNSIEDLTVTTETIYGAQVIEISGNENIPVGQNGEIVVKTSAKNGRSITYKITVERTDDLDFDDIVILVEDAIDSLKVNNDYTKADLQSVVNFAVTGWNCSVTVDDFYLCKAIDGAVEDNGTVLVPGYKGEMAALITIDDGENTKTLNVQKSIAQKMESFTFASESKEEDFELSADGKKLLSYSGNAEKIIIPEGVEVLDDIWFYGEPYEVKAIILPESLTALPSDMCYGMINLEVVYMGDKVTSTEGSIFAGCVSLRYVKLSHSLNSIGYAMFRNTLSLDKLYIPSSVTSIGVSAFEYSLLRDIVVPSSVKEIGKYAFAWTVNNANYFASSNNLGIKIEAELASKIHDKYVNKYAYKVDRVVYVMNPEVLLPDTGIFSTDKTGAWGKFDIRIPTGSNLELWIQNKYEDLLDGKFVKYQIVDMSLCEAAARAQFVADSAYVNSDDNADSIMRQITGAYSSSSITAVKWKENFTMDEINAKGVLNISDHTGNSFDVGISVGLLPIYVNPLDDENQEEKPVFIPPVIDDEEENTDDFEIDNNIEFESSDTETNKENTEQKYLVTKGKKIKKISRRKKPPVDVNVFQVFDGNTLTGVLIYSCCLVFLAGIATVVILIIKKRKKNK